MHTLTKFYTKMVDLVNSDESYPQGGILDYISKEVRGIPEEILRNQKAFYVPDNIYLNWITEGEASDNRYGLYWGDKCILNQRLIIPITDFKGNIAGLCGYDDGRDNKEDEEHIKYRYLNKDVFDKERHWLITPDEYLKAVNEQYIMIVDGIFDKLILSHSGYNSASLLGTHLSRYHIKYLSTIKNWIVVSDQDRAGVELFDKCRMANKKGNTIQLLFNGAEDIDQKIRIDINALEKLEKAFNNMRTEGFTLSCNMDNVNFNQL